LCKILEYSFLEPQIQKGELIMATGPWEWDKLTPKEEENVGALESLIDSVIKERGKKCTRIINLFLTKEVLRQKIQKALREKYLGAGWETVIFSHSDNNHIYVSLTAAH
jgi:hypothetical protein